MQRWLYPFERRLLRRRRGRLAAALILAFICLLLCDRAVYHALAVGPDRLPALEGKDWYRTLRSAGTLLPWLFLAAGLTLQGAAAAITSRARSTSIPGLLILASAALAGALAELLQVLTGRIRPNHTDGVCRFKGLLERFANPDNLCFPSSHAAVAFGAAFMVLFLYPRAGWVAILLAAGCGLTRLLAGAHFASDVFAAAVLGYATASLLRPAQDRRGLLLP